jgi:hypothetical protein
MTADRAAREEEAQELGRYRADVTAALLPAGVRTLAGALAGFAVFFVPVLIVGGSMLLINLTFNVGIIPFQWVVRTFGIRVPRGQPIAQPTPALTLATPRPTEIPPLPVEGPMVAEMSPATAVALVLFWPLAMFAIGASLAWLYSWRRRRQIDALRRSPVELRILPEAALFYALTAAAGLLVGVGSFVALGANVAFAWAGALIWRWLFDRLAWRLAPTAVRDEAQALSRRERDYRRSAREAG